MTWNDSLKNKILYGVIAVTNSSCLDLTKEQIDSMPGYVAPEALVTGLFAGIGALVTVSTTLSTGRGKQIMEYKGELHQYKTYYNGERIVRNVAAVATVGLAALTWYLS